MLKHFILMVALLAHLHGYQIPPQTCHMVGTHRVCVPKGVIG